MQVMMQMMQPQTICITCITHQDLFLANRTPLLRKLLSQANVLPHLNRGSAVNGGPKIKLASWHLAPPSGGADLKAYGQFRRPCGGTLWRQVVCMWGKEEHSQWANGRRGTGKGTRGGRGKEKVKEEEEQEEEEEKEKEEEEEEVAKEKEEEEEEERGRVGSGLVKVRSEWIV